MADAPVLALSLYPGWDYLQRLLIKAIAPLTDNELDLRPAPRLRSVRENCLHIIGARGRWCAEVLEIGGEAAKEFGRWDRAGMPSRSAAELASALSASWQLLRTALITWTNDDLDEAHPNPDPGPGEPDPASRRWVLWHLIEHDIFHGGEISVMLGMHGLPGLGL